MGLVVDNLEQAMRRTFAPARQLGLARFLDAALRGVAPRESSGPRGRLDAGDAAAALQGIAALAAGSAVTPGPWLAKPADHDVQSPDGQREQPVTLPDPLTTQELAGTATVNATSADRDPVPACS